jgi:hypothetical protein
VSRVDLPEHLERGLEGEHSARPGVELASDGIEIGLGVDAGSVPLGQGLFAERIAVGTRLTARPPHRTGRARLRHPAPTLGV